MLLRIHKEGRFILIASAIALTALNFIVANYASDTVLLISLLVSIVLYGLFLQFFRLFLEWQYKNPLSVFLVALGLIDVLLLFWLILQVRG